MRAQPIIARARSFIVGPSFVIKRQSVLQRQMPEQSSQQAEINAVKPGYYGTGQNGNLTTTDRLSG